MKTSIKSIHSVNVSVLLRTLCACLVVLALSLATIRSGAVDADADAKQAMADWKAAVAAVGEAKKAAKAAQEKKGIALANFKSGGITEAEQKILDQLLAEEAAANAALEAAMERLFAAREALENALQALADDSALKKELKRQRDGLILDDPNARGESRRTKKTGSQMQQIAQTQTSGGLHVTTFNTEHGRVIVNLPDYISVGDTISGTVFTEPTGNTAEEKAKNQSVLNGTVIDLGGTKIQAERPTFSWIPAVPQPGVPPRYVLRIVEIGQNTPEVTKSQTIVTVNPKAAPNPNATNTFVIPPLGQTGRTIVITGPFDGKSINTAVEWDRYLPKETLHGTFNVLAESSSGKLVVSSPDNVTGPIQITVKEGDKQATGTYRNVGVNLTAPKTTLQKREQTELKIEVSGLQGITQPVPLTLESRGVIAMAGGNYQPLSIQPSQVGSDGSYSTTRAITGLQAGAWGATATVVTERFNACFESDNPVAPRLVRLNTVTGDYMFSSPGCSAASQSAGESITGKGTVAMKGCILNLTQNAPDRRIHITIDQCKKMGSAAVEMRPTGLKFTMSDPIRGEDCDNCP